MKNTGKKRKRGIEDRTKMFDIYLLGILEGGKKWSRYNIWRVDHWNSSITLNQSLKKSNKVQKYTLKVIPM